MLDPAPDNGRALFIPTDRAWVCRAARRAAGQTTILTGATCPPDREHYYAHPEIRAIVNADNIFKRVLAGGGTTR